MAQKSDRLPIARSRQFIINKDSPFVITEAYKTARTNLIFSLAPCKSKITVVTSCSPTEGKSTNCLNLAITMAQMGASVLIIDADMRKPVLHSLIEVDNKAGLSTVLGGITDDIAQVIHRQVRPSLDVLTSGPIPPNPAELLSSKKMEQLLEIVGEHYDYVFIDAPPILVVSDALLMNEYTAGMIFVIKENSTGHPAINEALERVKMTNGKILGFIRANCNSKGKRSYKTYKYKYQYQYKYEDKNKDTENNPFLNGENTQYPDAQGNDTTL